VALARGATERETQVPRMFRFFAATMIAGTFTSRIKRTHQMLIRFRKTSLPVCTVSRVKKL
jgi:hypothetical protein